MTAPLETLTLPAPPRMDFCAECGNPFHAHAGGPLGKLYCSRPCQLARNARRTHGGYKLYDAVMQWRIERPDGALGDLTALADQLAHEERKIRDRRCARIKEAKATLKKA